MTLKEITDRLEALGIPTAYLKFNKPQELPFQVWYEKSAEIKGADNYNLYRECQMIVEIYSAARDIPLESRFEAAFRDVELEKLCAYLKDEDMHMTAYSFNIIQKYGG
jgi:hypothetical protein|nr:MAG TPA: hypothetical protein [Caudoviricetes sp.]